MSEITIRQARQQAAQDLADVGIDTAVLDARLLMAFVLDVSQTQLLIRDPDLMSPGDLERFRHLIIARATGEPVAYLTGEREFMGLTFHTTADVLVPRPDTEPLVEWGLAWLRKHPNATVADIGTGSGAIAIATTFHAPESWTGSTIATDISDGALTIAKANAEAILSADRRQRITFATGYLLEALKNQVDLLLTNLPYLTPEQIAKNAHLSHEPILALDGGPDGLDLIRKVVDHLSGVLAPGGAVGFEIDPSQSEEVQRLLRMALPNHRVEIVHDLAGDERHIVAY